MKRKSCSELFSTKTNAKTFNPENLGEGGGGAYHHVLPFCTKGFFRLIFRFP